MRMQRAVTEREIRGRMDGEREREIERERVRERDVGPRLGGAQV